MKALHKPITFNEESYDVALVHKTLEAFGLKISPEEVKQKKAGDDTSKKIRALQAELNVPINKSALMDEATQFALLEALEKRGLTEASHSFTVTGAVRLQDGSLKKRQRLLAFDLNLHAIAVYRSVKSVAEIEKNSGFEFLGQAVSDSRGNYRITFYDFQYRRSAHKKADVVVYAVDENKKSKQVILGHSPLVNSEDYSEKGLLRGLDITIAQADKRTEYENLMGPLKAFLKESGVSLGEVAKSSEQLASIAGELDIDPSRLNLAARAELLMQPKDKRFSHQLLYGIGRQNIRLEWRILYKKLDEELETAVAKSIESQIIYNPKKGELTAFLLALRECAVRWALDDKQGESGITLNTLLSNALPEENQRLSFLNAVSTFKGKNFSKFWSEHLPAQPEFKDKPQLISSLLLTQQLTLLTGNHEALVKELQGNRKLSSIDELLALETEDWLAIVHKAGVPDFVKGENQEERAQGYATWMQSSLNAAFPTKRIARMVARNQLPIEKSKVSEDIAGFLAKNIEFDFATSRIRDYEEQIKLEAGDDLQLVTSELMKIQRVFQVSTTPEAMIGLLDNDLHSAYTIANIPPKSFIKTYSGVVGGQRAAFAIHQRATHIATKTEISAVYMMDYSQGTAPATAQTAFQRAEALTVLQNAVPNYVNLFGSPDICECEHCRSIYSPAAYLVELLHFLFRSDGGTVLEVLRARRPDLQYLRLTCENTNTIIPYIDLANEVMEFYVAHDSLADFKGSDTGEATAKELRANPQSFIFDAYHKLKDAKYPFTLPYHQPLDSIRTYSDHLNVSRYEAMKAMNPVPDAATQKAIEAESLGISLEEYIIITGETFDGTGDTTDLHEYFGYSDPADFARIQRIQGEEDAGINPRGIRVLLERTGIKYSDLVELVKTHFINPYQNTLDFLQRFIRVSAMKAPEFYEKLTQIEAGTAPDADIVAAISEYNSANHKDLTSSQFAEWVLEHFSKFRQVITLHEHDSNCNLETTRLRIIRRIYNDPPTTPEIEDIPWSRIHRFIRLWRKLGWSIHELDIVLSALGEEDITSQTISKLESFALLSKATRLSLNQLAVLWGNLDTNGDKSLYKKLFLNKAVQQIDNAFKADGLGEYLADDSIFLADHRSAILAAFRIGDGDLAAILDVARVLDLGTSRRIDLNTDVLSLANLSTMFRYVVFAKALKLSVIDVCKLISLFGATPFSTWDIQAEKFTGIAPKATYDFYKLADSTKTSGFKPSVLEYVLQGSLPVDSLIGLDRNKTLQAAKAIRDALLAIEQEHPEAPPSPLTAEILTTKLVRTFQPEMVSRFMGILDGTASFKADSASNLDVEIPDELNTKYSYVKGSGRLTCVGIMSDAEQITLKTLAGIDGPDGTFQKAVTAIYAAPETFIIENFNGETYEKFDATLVAVVFPDPLKDKISYDDPGKRLIFRGIMAQAEKEQLILLSGDEPYQKAINALYQKSQKTHGIFSHLVQANGTLLNHGAQAFAATIEEKLVYVYERFIPVLKIQLRRDVITQHIAALIGLSEEATSLLIARDIEALITGLSTEGFSATYYNDPTWSRATLVRNDREVNFPWGNAAPDPLISADNFSVRWQAYIAPPTSGESTLVVDVAEANETFKLYLDDALILEKSAADTGTSREIVATFNAARMHLLKLDYAEASQNASARLRWKTAATGLEVVPAQVAYPAAILDTFAALVSVYHRAAKFIAGFKINEIELDHLITFKADFGNIDFQALTTGSWQRIRDYTTLRNNVPQAQALLTDVFAAANMPVPEPYLTELVMELLHRATAWDKSNLTLLFEELPIEGVNFFKNEIAFNQLREVMQILAKTGLAAITFVKWGASERDFAELNITAQLIKNTLRAKFEEKDWLDLAGNLSDKIRENQQRALIAYLLTKPEIGAQDADGLFEYFLIDVQMGACMDTSRIVQANASIQMFINRCLLNLESVSPDAIDKERWEWMKNYRVWEANRKVFLYPENWLEPERRNDRSEFFRELESYLVQNDITDRSVEQAFRNYLTSLNEVANLDVCGMHQENVDDGKLLHVFARTHNAPYKYFYRRWHDKKWSAWEKVQLDIRSVEAGDESGVHLMPVVWKKRLFLFWPEFIEKQKPPPRETGQTVRNAFNATMSNLEADKYWEIRLAWSEYVEGRWSPKQVSKEFTIEEPFGKVHTEKDLLFTASISSTKLLIRAVDPCGNFRKGFSLSDIQSPVKIIDPPSDSLHGPNKRIPAKPYRMVCDQESDYSYFFSQREASSSELQLMNDVYLEKPTSHKLLPVDTMKEPDITLETPFFFSDALRTYFVDPSATIPDSHGIRYPDRHNGFNQGLPDNNSFNIPSVGSNTVPTRVPAGFGGHIPTNRGQSRVGDRKVLEFHIFHHPFSSQYVENLNRGGLSRGNKAREYPAGLMESGTEIPSDGGGRFVTNYEPHFEEGLVKELAGLSSGTYYQENVCFDVYGANSLYNWELFFHAPLYIATRLSKNGKFKEALKWFHYIFDPTTDELPGPGESETSHYWKVLPFKKEHKKTLEELLKELNSETNPLSPTYNASSTWFANVAEWRANPFDPHLMAANRPLAYMKHVVIKYVENLIAWGDSLFRQFQRESVNEALQIYVIANHILGPRPEFVPKRGEIKAESYDSLKDKLDEFSNALVELENTFPYSSEASVSSSSTGTNLLGVGSALYFCIPANDKLIGYWDLVADRLFKIRHCQDIDGVERSLALFSPPIDPGALILATSQGLSLGSILADLSSPPPIYRFTYLLQKANEFCADVKGLGSALLATLEKKDTEELGRLRASHETQMLELVTIIRERQVLDAKANKENLEKARETANFRLDHYLSLLDNDSVTVPAALTISATLTANSQLPADTNIVTITTDVDESLEDSAESGVKVIPKEKEALDANEAAKWITLGASLASQLGGILSLFPEASTDGKPFGIGAGALWGGQNLGFAASESGRAASTFANFLSHGSAQAVTMASYIRREQDWTLQANLAAKEIIQVDKQITSADIRIQVAEKEVENHRQQIENGKQVELYLKDKFTNLDLYQWMKEQLFAVYKQSYNLAYDLAKMAEKAYRYETGSERASFIQYGYWDNSTQGLVAGEKLQLALRQLEKCYIEENRREFELTKHVSLALLNPLELVKLRETGRCFINLPEEVFDLDFPGHYFRRIKSVSMTLPCVVGPYTTPSCTLRLTKNSIRINTANGDNGYARNTDDAGLPADDRRFSENNSPVKVIAASNSQNESGVFELSFRDERYLPFEGAGAISAWSLELFSDNSADFGKSLRQFDYGTISDVILHVKYTAREDSGPFKDGAIAHLRDYFRQEGTIPALRMFNLRQEFPTQWHRFLHPSDAAAGNIFEMDVSNNLFHYRDHDKILKINTITLLARCTDNGNYTIVLNPPLSAGSDTFTLNRKDEFGGLHFAQTPGGADMGIEIAPGNPPVKWQLKMSRPGGGNLQVDDVLVVLGYEWNNDA